VLKLFIFMDKILETEVQRCTVHVHVYNVLYVVLSYFRKYNNVVRKYNLVVRVLPEVFYFRGTFVLSYFRTSGSTEVLSYFGSTSVRALYGNRYESTFEGTSGIDTAT
jgi:hypothetical protein